MTDITTIIAKAIYDHDNPSCPQFQPCGRKRPCPFNALPDHEKIPYIEKGRAVVDAITCDKMTLARAGALIDAAWRKEVA